MTHRPAVLALALLLAAPAAADDAALAVVRKAVAAHGGADALNRSRAGRFQVKGEMNLLGEQVPYTGDLLFQVPDRYKLSGTFDTKDGGPLKVVQVVYGRAARVTVNGVAVPLGKGEEDELLNLAQFQEVAQLTPLLDPAKYAVKSDADAKADGRDAAAVTAAGKALRGKEIKLFFDRGSGLLVKTERKAQIPGGGAGLEEVFLTDHKVFDGLRLPTRHAVKHDGKPFTAMEVVAVKHLDRVDESEFADGPKGERK